MIRTVIIAMLISLAGCTSRPPEPPDQIHAVFSDKPVTSLGINEPFDTVITVTVDSVEKYGETTEGDWITEYHLGRLNVLQILEGPFSMTKMNFGFQTAYPTPESGIVLDASPPVVQPGNHLALWMNTKVQPFVVVFCQTRSSQEGWSHLSPAENMKITRAFEKYLGSCPRHLEYKKQTDTSHVISDGARTLTVDK